MDRKSVEVLKDTKQLLLPASPDVAQLIPSHERKIIKGKKHLVIPHSPITTKIMYRLGYDVPSALKTYYDWNGSTPYEHQKTTTELLVHAERCYILNDMGTGKTLSVLYAIDYLKRFEGMAQDKVLVIAPLSILSVVWEHEVFKWVSHLEAVVLHGTKKKRLQLLAEDHDIYIINHDGVESIINELIDKKFKIVVLDELTAYKNHRTNRWKAASKLFPYQGVRVWGLTGSPTPQAPTDAYGQVKLITPNRVSKSFKMFQSKTMLQVSPFTWIPKSTANDDVYKAMQPAVRFKMEDCISLPPVTVNDLEIPMSKKQTKAYEQLNQHYRLQFQQGEVNAANEGVKLSKLLQIGCGFVYRSDTVGAVKIDDGDRLDVLENIINAARQKVIVFLPFRFGVKMLYRELKKRGVSCEVVHGGVSKTSRDLIFKSFQEEDTPRVLIAHPKTMAHGLTLTAANVVVWYSPSPSLEVYLQANARVRRPSQQYKQYIIHLYGCPVEAKVFQRLEAREKVQGSLLEMFES